MLAQNRDHTSGVAALLCGLLSLDAVDAVGTPLESVVVLLVGSFYVMSFEFPPCSVAMTCSLYLEMRRWAVG